MKKTDFHSMPQNRTINALYHKELDAFCSDVITMLAKGNHSILANVILDISNKLAAWNKIGRLLSYNAILHLDKAKAFMLYVEAGRHAKTISKIIEATKKVQHISDVANIVYFLDSVYVPLLHNSIAAIKTHSSKEEINALATVLHNILLDSALANKIMLGDIYATKNLIDFYRNVCNVICGITGDNNDLDKIVTNEKAPLMSKMGVLIATGTLSHYNGWNIIKNMLPTLSVNDRNVIIGAIELVANDAQEKNLFLHNADDMLLLLGEILCYCLDDETNIAIEMLDISGLDICVRDIIALAPDRKKTITVVLDYFSRYSDDYSEAGQCIVRIFADGIAKLLTENDKLDTNILSEDFISKYSDNVIFRGMARYLVARILDSPSQLAKLAAVGTVANLLQDSFSPGIAAEQKEAIDKLLKATSALQEYAFTNIERSLDVIMGLPAGIPFGDNRLHIDSNNVIVEFVISIFCEIQQRLSSEQALQSLDNIIQALVRRNLYNDVIIEQLCLFWRLLVAAGNITADTAMKATQIILQK